MLEAFPSLRPGDAKSIRLRGLSRLFRSAESASALKAFWRERGRERKNLRSGVDCGPPGLGTRSLSARREGGQPGVLPGGAPSSPSAIPGLLQRPGRAAGSAGGKRCLGKKEISLPQGTARKNPAGREARKQPGRSGGRGTAPPLGVFGKVKASLFAHLRAPAARGMQAGLQLLSPRQGAAGRPGASGSRGSGRAAGKLRGARSAAPGEPAGALGAPGHLLPSSCPFPPSLPGRAPRGTPQPARSVARALSPYWVLWPLGVLGFFFFN